MPFTLRPYRRFPVHCAVTYNAGPFGDGDTAGATRDADSGTSTRLHEGAKFACN